MTQLNKFRDRDDTDEQVWGPKWSICEFGDEMTRQYNFRGRWWILV